jgi:hypothetical protein
VTSNRSVAFKISAASLVFLALAGCSRRGELDETGGIVTVRNSCPSAAIPAMTGDITVFDPAGRTDAAAIDVVAEITNLRSNCSEAGDQFYTQATFDVHASRRDASGPRDVMLPYFSVVVRGGNVVVAKRVGQVSISFAPGEYRASASATASSYVDRGAASLPEDIRVKITKKRKSGDYDAAVDPMALPEVKEALKRTSFDLLVGFNLTQDQFRYNATR